VTSAATSKGVRACSTAFIGDIGGERQRAVRPQLGGQGLQASFRRAAYGKAD
jgi:hypothetical protein